MSHSKEEDGLFVLPIMTRCQTVYKKLLGSYIYSWGIGILNNRGLKEQMSWWAFWMCYFYEWKTKEMYFIDSRSGNLFFTVFVTNTWIFYQTNKHIHWGRGDRASRLPQTGAVKWYRSHCAWGLLHIVLLVMLHSLMQIIKTKETKKQLRNICI